MDASSVLNHYSGAPHVMEGGNQDWSSQYFWDFLTKPDRPEPRPLATYEESRVQHETYEETNDHVVNMRLVNNFQESNVAHEEETRVEDNEETQFVEDIEMNAYYGNDFVVPDETKVNHEPVVPPEYEQFVKAVENRNQPKIKEFIESHPEALALPLFAKSRTALHYAARFMDVDTVKTLVGLMDAKDMEIVDKDGYTALALAAKYDHTHIERILGLMLDKNLNLFEIGSLDRNPIIVASGSGTKTATRFLFGYLDTKIYMKEYSHEGVRLLINCIYFKYFDIAMELVRKRPKVLLMRDGTYGGYPIKAFAQALNDLRTKGTFGHTNKSGSGDSLFGCLRPPPGDEPIYDEHTKNNNEVREAREFLKLICDEVGRYTKQQLKTAVHEAMMFAARYGTTEFIEAMLKANKHLIWAKDDQDRGMFLYAINYRQEEAFCLIYQYGNYKDMLLEMPPQPEKEDGNNDQDALLQLVSKLPQGKDDSNLVHLLAKLPEEDDGGGNVLHVVAQYDLHRAGGESVSSFLQMQKEIQWFKGVANLAKLHYRFDPNDKGDMPNDVFIKKHEPLVEVGMKSMKDLATAATVVGSLIITTMFAALFTAPGGNEETTGYPLFIGEVPFKFFIIFDALSLFSSTTSVLLFLGILTSRFSAKDFDKRLPRKLLNGFATLFFSITTMMLSFCTALVIMFHGRLLFIAPIILLAIVPVVFFSRSVCPLLSEIYVSTYRPSIFEKHQEKMEKKDQMKREDISYLSDSDEEDEKMMPYSYGVDKMV